MMTARSDRFSTQERIIEAAEELFVERGFAGTSLRAITAAARVNLGAVHYHFGSKEGLFEAVFHHRIEPIIQESLKRLDQLEAHVDRQPPQLEEILDAFLAPVLASEPGGVERLVGRLYAEPRSLVDPIIERLFTGLSERFLSAIARALGDVAEEELRWRFHFTVGAMLHAIVREEPVGVGPAPSPTADGPEARLRRLAAFAAAGIRQSGARGSGP